MTGELEQLREEVGRLQRLADSLDSPQRRRIVRARAKRQRDTAAAPIRPCGEFPIAKRGTFEETAANIRANDAAFGPALDKASR